MLDNVMFEIFRMNMWELCLSNFLAAIMLLTWIGVVVIIRCVVRTWSSEKHDYEVLKRNCNEQVRRERSLSESSRHQRDHIEEEMRRNAESSYKTEEYLKDRIRKLENPPDSKEAPDVEDDE